MSAISLKSITGITSITTPAGVDNQLTLHTNNTTERVKIDVAGNVHVNNHLSIAGVTTVANDTQLIIGSNADNRIPFKIKQNTSASNHNQIDSRFTYFYSHAIRFWDQDNTSQAVAYFWNNQI